MCCVIGKVYRRSTEKTSWLCLPKFLCYGRSIISHATHQEHPHTDSTGTVTSAARPPIVAIIGRPNVGKSTLFNRMLGKRTAIVDDVPGVTRDRNYADGTYRNRPFRLVDTGGLDPSASEGMLALIKRQSELAIAEADILVLLMDGRTGLTTPDQAVVRLLRGTPKPLFVVINKIDTPKVETLVADFYQLGTDTLYPISAEHGIGVSELLDDIYPLLPDPGENPEQSTIPRIAVVGRPNVGKSTLVNAVLGEDRVVVSDVPGTTRDSIDSIALHQGRRYLFTDTAGIRRRGKIDRGIEGYSVVRSHLAIGRSDLGILLLDATEGVTEQDTKIAGIIIKQGRACFLLVNKWDLREGDSQARQEVEQELHRRFPFLTWAPVLFASAAEPWLVEPALSDYRSGIRSVFKTNPDRSLEQVPPGNPRHPPSAGAERQTDEDHQICLHDPSRHTPAGLCLIRRSSGQHYPRLPPLSREPTP